MYILNHGHVSLFSEGILKAVYTEIKKKMLKLLVLCSHSKNICHHELYEDIELIIKVNENIKSNFN